jgi:hypothetical protein
MRLTVSAAGYLEQQKFTYYACVCNGAGTEHLHNYTL